MICPFCKKALILPTELFLEATIQQSTLDIPLPFHYCDYYKTMLEPTLLIFAPAFIIAYQQNQQYTIQLQSGYIQCGLTLYADEYDSFYTFNDLTKYTNYCFRIKNFLFLPLQSLFIAETQLQNIDHLKIVDVVLEN